MRLKTDFLPTPKKALPISHPARLYFMISLVCCSYVRLVSKMLTGIQCLIATSYANSTSKKDLICSFFFIYDEEVTIRKRKSVLGHFAATEACIRLVFAFSRSSEMSISSSLVALMALSFSPPLMKIVCFCSTGFYQCLCNSYKVVLSFASG